MVSFIFGVITGVWLAAKIDKVRELVNRVKNPFRTRYEIVHVFDSFAIRASTRTDTWISRTEYFLNIRAFREWGNGYIAWVPLEPGGGNLGFFKAACLSSLEVCRDILAKHPWDPDPVELKCEVVE